METFGPYSYPLSSQQRILDCVDTEASRYFFFKINFFKNSFRNTIIVSNSSDPDQPGFLSGLIWAKTVSKVYQQRTLVGTFSFKINYFENSFRIAIIVSNSSDPDQAQLFVGPDLDPNCLKRLSADETSRCMYFFFLSKSTFLKILSGFPSECQTISDPDQAQLFVGPDLDPNCLQMLSADDTSRQRDKRTNHSYSSRR